MSPDLGHLRQVGLTHFEVQTITLLARSSGEVTWYPERVKPLTRQCMDQLIGKQLVAVLNRGGVLAIRLTDQGRSVASQLEAIDVKPKIEVASS